MRNTVITVIILVVVAVGVYSLSKTPAAQTAITGFENIDNIVHIANKLDEFIPYMAYDIEEFKQTHAQSQEEIKELTKLVQTLLSENIDLQGELKDIKDYIIIDIPQVIPEDFEECLEELDKTRDLKDTLLYVVSEQKSNIYTLQSINTNQQIIIDRQEEIIQIYKKDLDTVVNNYEQIIDEANRRRRIGYIVGVLGIAAALML